MFSDIRALLFDFDGTLVQPSIDFDDMRAQVLGAVADLGLDTSTYERMHVLEMIERVACDLRNGAQAIAFRARTDRIILEIELEAAERTAPYAGVPEMLAELSQRGYPVGIVTRNCRAAVETILSRYSLPHQVLLTRDDIAHVKPDPRHLLAALEVLGVAGDRSLMCGDHPMDVQAGQRIGARTVGVLPPGAGPERFAEATPDLVLDDVTRLLAHLDHN